MEHLKVIDRGAKVSRPLNLEPGLYNIIVNGTRDGVGLCIGWQVFHLTDSQVVKLESGGITRAELVNVGSETDVEIHLAKLEAVTDWRTDART